MNDISESDPRHPKNRSALWANRLTGGGLVLTALGLVITVFTFIEAQNASKQAEKAEQAARDAETAVRKSAQRISLVSSAEPHISKMAELGKDFENRCRIALTYAEIEISEYDTKYILRLLRQVLDLSVDGNEVLNCSGHTDALEVSTPENPPAVNVNNGFNPQEIVLATYQVKNCHVAKKALNSFTANSAQLQGLEGAFKLAVSPKYARVIFSTDGQDQQSDLSRIRDIGRTVGADPSTSFEKQNLKFISGAYLSATSDWVDAAGNNACVEGAKYEDF